MLDPQAAPINREALERFATGRFASQMEVKRHFDLYLGLLYDGCMIYVDQSDWGDFAS